MMSGMDVLKGVDLDKYHIHPGNPSIDYRLQEENYFAPSDIDISENPDSSRTNDWFKKNAEILDFGKESLCFLFPERCGVQEASDTKVIVQKQQQSNTLLVIGGVLITLLLLVLIFKK